MLRLYRKIAWLPLVVAYTGLALALTHPLVWHLASRVPHDLGDPLLSTVILWWNARHAPLTADWANPPFFHPAMGALAFSDHRLGLSLLASPLQWAGLPPLAAYNVTLIATFPLCALAAHWLAFTLTRRHDASALAGLAYGFSPYRFAHIEHLELLAAFGMPIALAALHRFWSERRIVWLAIFGAALLLQALSSTYYFLFFLVMLALWIGWFARLHDAWALSLVGAAVAMVGAAIAPLALTYLRVHELYGLKRAPHEVAAFSADITSFVTASSISALWGWTSTLNGSERQLFPGATIVAIVAAGVVAAIVSTRPRFRGNRVAAICAGLAGVFAFAAARAWRRAWRLGVISVGTRFKPLSIAFVALAASVAASSWCREAYRRRSALAFYTLASVLLFVLTLGPEPAFRDRQILYEPPYAWLMRLPLFGESVRVPARFAMLGILALSTAAALAFNRLIAPRARTVLAAAAIAGIVADAWISPLPLLEPPRVWPSEVSTAGLASFIELPIGDAIGDSQAMYRSMLTGLPTVNGYSGYVPPHYHALRMAIEEADESAIEALAEGGRLLVAIDWSWRLGTAWIRRLRELPRSRDLAASAETAWFVVEARPSNPSACASTTLPVAAVRDRWKAIDPTMLRDGDDRTLWYSEAGQQRGDGLTIDLGRLARPCSVRTALGARVAEYPRILSVATSPDAVAWQTSFHGKVGGAAVAAALRQPRHAVLDFTLPDAPARFIRLQLEADQPRVTWIVTELTVTGTPIE